MEGNSGIPQRIDRLTDPCDIVRRWKVEPEVAIKATRMAGFLPFGVSIISGYRSPARQEELIAEGRPAAPVGLSNHTRCPATALDFRVDIAVTDIVKAEFGRVATFVGFRWGGGSPVDPDTGIPSDWNHVDLGPRNA